MRTAKSNRYELPFTNCHRRAAGSDWCASIYHVALCYFRAEPARNPKLICACIRMYRCCSGAEEANQPQTKQNEMEIKTKEDIANFIESHLKELGGEAFGVNYISEKLFEWHESQMKNQTTPEERGDRPKLKPCYITDKINKLNTALKHIEEDEDFRLSDTMQWTEQRSFIEGKINALTNLKLLLTK